MNYWTKVIKRILIFILSIFIIGITLKLTCFYIPFLIGFIISLLIEPIIIFLSKHNNFSRKTNSIIVLILCFIILLGLISYGIIALISEAYNLLQNLNVYIEKISNITSKFNLEKLNLPSQVINLLEESTQNIIQYFNDFIVGFLTKLLQSVKNIPFIGIYVVITILSTFFICTDKIFITDQLEHHFPSKLLKKFKKKMRAVISALGCYLKAESILIGVSFAEVLVGLYLFKLLGLNIKFPLIIALVTGFVDALPILGTGTVLIPWAVFSACNGDVTLGISLMCLYIIVTVVRQFIEPKIISKNIGIHPIFTLIAMYTGFKASGFIGLLIGPIVLIILKEVFSNMIDDGIVKNIMKKE